VNGDYLGSGFNNDMAGLNIMSAILNKQHIPILFTVFN